MEAALAEFIELTNTGVALQEADWSKVRGLEFREALTERDELAKELAFFAVDDDQFAESVCEGFLFLPFLIVGLMIDESSTNLSMASVFWRRR